MSLQHKVTVGYIPEHFSVPLLLARDHKIFDNLKLSVEFIPCPEGSGRLISLLKSKEIDIAIGLTEAFVRGLCQGDDSYQIQGEYVKSPLCWAISTGYGRDDIEDEADLTKCNTTKVGVSRIGSGSYVMSYVLALKLKLGESPFEFEVLHNFQNLRASVNKQTTDIFLWEYFTTRKYYENKELKQIGEIYTPWSSWVVVSSRSRDLKPSLELFLDGLQRGIQYYQEHQEEAIDYILEHLDYNSKTDLQQWAKRTVFSNNVRLVDFQRNIIGTKDVLRLAGVVDNEDDVILERLHEGVRQ